jgi:hypothetical protein
MPRWKEVRQSGQAGLHIGENQRVPDLRHPVLGAGYGVSILDKIWHDQTREDRDRVRKMDDERQRAEHWYQAVAMSMQKREIEGRRAILPSGSRSFPSLTSSIGGRIGDGSLYEGQPPMFCRSVRNLVWAQRVLTAGVCLALIGMFPTLPLVSPEDETPSLTIRAPEFPLTALIQNASLRLEKLAEAHRLSPQKPEQIRRASVAIWHPNLNPRAVPPRVFRGFPRRLLYPRHVALSSLDDPSSPSLS